MNNLDKQYQELLQDILDNGVEKKDRTGTGTLSVFGRQIRHKMSEGFPLLTTKKMYWKGIVVELLWFLRGDTNIKFLHDNNCHIWDGDAYKKYKKEWSKYVPGDGSFKESEYNTSKPHEAIPYTKEERSIISCAIISLTSCSFNLLICISIFIINIHINY